MSTVPLSFLSAEDILTLLLDAVPQRTALAPKDSRGIYGLVDHLGVLRYVGSTSSGSQSFYERIHQRHRTGSEDSSHYFSRMYNTGRMWRMRKVPVSRSDAAVAKKLRNEFIADHCRAVWVPLSDTADIAGLERDVIELAPSESTAWNQRATEAYIEPQGLVDETITRLKLTAAEHAAIGRQKQRYDAILSGPITPKPSMVPPKKTAPPFPVGPFRFFALDVETANNNRGSICQIGVACVRPDNKIETWMTHVDPQADHWAFTYLHKIDAKTVRGAPIFQDVLPVLADALRTAVVYQHSNFDRTAIAAACRSSGLCEPDWDWHDSVQVARSAWPDLKGKGGHGLASLKSHLGLLFKHHDAGEDARASAEVVLRAETESREAGETSQSIEPVFDVTDDFDDTQKSPIIGSVVTPAAGRVNFRARIIGKTTLTSGNIKNNHIYLQEFFNAFPQDVIGGSNTAAAASRTISVDWGGDKAVVTDLDGTKKLFRKRGWVRKFVERTSAVAGNTVVVEMHGPYQYRVTLERGDIE